MSYSIYIGEARLRQNIRELDASYIVDCIEQNDAPEWPSKVDISGKTNVRSPGYSAMYEFAKVSGLHELFFNKEEGILKQHPGIIALTPEMRDAVKSARDNWEHLNPQAKPGWEDGGDMILARLIWYEWWMNWALKNCSHPAIYNT